LADAYLIVIYGAPFVGKSTLAWELARRLPGKSAIVSADQLLGGAIARPDDDALAELEMVSIQMRLLVASYLKNRYHVVVEAPFYYEREGELHSYESDVDQLAALMRNLTSKTMIVRLDAPPATMSHRAHEDGREDEVATALHIREAYKERSGARYRAFDTSQQSAGDIATVLLEQLNG
jgi:deoxyadenosine/deoxycytidine kinase